MEQYKRAQVIMLPTGIAKSDYNQLWLCDLNNLYNATAVKGVKSHKDTKFQELYILSNDKIKEGDWTIFNNKKKRTQYPLQYSNDIGLPKFLFKKIIATTDKSIRFATGEQWPEWEYLPEPSQQFITKYIESYNKGKIITDVLVELLSEESYGCDLAYYGLSEPGIKINSKDNTITIKKLKDNCNREEHIINIKKFAKEFVANTNTAYKQKDIDDWISNNL